VSPFEHAFCAAFAYAVLHAGLRRYNCGWRRPDDAATANWPRRTRLGFVLGLLCVVLAVVALRTTGAAPAANALLTAQIVLMAAAGASDVQCYRLPAPLTLCGLVLAGALLRRESVPGVLVALALLWSALLIGVHVLITRNRMGWGDHLAVLWLALASPIYGLFAIAAGQSVLWLSARVSGWGRRPIPVGGAWLLAGVLVVGYFGMGDLAYEAHISREARGYLGAGHAYSLARIPRVARVAFGHGGTSPRATRGYGDSTSLGLSAMLVNPVAQEDGCEMPMDLLPQRGCITVAPGCAGACAPMSECHPRYPGCMRSEADTHRHRATCLLSHIGDLIASIALVNTPDARRALAQSVAARIDALVATDVLTTDERDMLRALGNALRRYDLSAIDALDARRVALCEHRRCAMGACPAQ
jgi:hypothetical protein